MKDTTPDFSQVMAEFNDHDDEQPTYGQDNMMINDTFNDSGPQASNGRLTYKQATDRQDDILTNGHVNDSDGKFITSKIRQVCMLLSHICVSVSMSSSKQLEAKSGDRERVEATERPFFPLHYET